MQILCTFFSGKSSSSVSPPPLSWASLPPPMLMCVCVCLGRGGGGEGGGAYFFTISTTGLGGGWLGQRFFFFFFFPWPVVVVVVGTNRGGETGRGILSPLYWSGSPSVTPATNMRKYGREVGPERHTQTHRQNDNKHFPPTDNALLTNFRQSSDAEFFFVNKCRLSMQVGAKHANACAQCVRVPTELPFCLPPLVVGFPLTFFFF